MKGKLIYTHGPHKGTLEICDELSIIDSVHADFFLKCFPAVVGFANHYLLEGVVPLIKGIGYFKNAPIIIKGNCHIAYYANDSSLKRLVIKNRIRKQNNIFILAVSEMSKLDYEGLGFRNVKVCEGFMYRDYDALLKIRPSNDNFCFVGQNGYLKGLDRSIECFMELKNKAIISQSSEFFVAGDHTNFLKRLPWSRAIYDDYKIRFIGSVHNVTELFSRCRFQLHLARYEPNAVSIMEGMAAGLLPLLSDKTGNVSHIRESGFESCVHYFSEQRTDYLRLAEIIYSARSLNLKDFSSRYSRASGRRRWRENYEECLCAHLS